MAIFAIFGIGGLFRNLRHDKGIGITLATYFGSAGLGTLVGFSPCFFSWGKTQPKKSAEADLRRQLSRQTSLERQLKLLQKASQYGYENLLKEYDSKLIRYPHLASTCKLIWGYAFDCKRDDVLVACIETANAYPRIVFNQWKDFSHPEVIRDAIANSTLAKWAITKPQGWVESNEVQPSAPPQGLGPV